MSAGAGKGTPKVCCDLSLLAPRFRAAVEAALVECEAAGLEPRVFETWRSGELQALYYQRGRSIIPPTRPVTFARSNLYSWHGYGLAVDVVHRTHYWSPPDGHRWFARVAEVFKRHGCAWGGDWKRSDPPHFQWGPCRPSPSDRARELLTSGGVTSVWEAVGAA